MIDLTYNWSEYLTIVIMIWDKAFKNGPNKICGRQPLKKFEGIFFKGPSSTNFTWSILEYFVLFVYISFFLTFLLWLSFGTKYSRMDQVNLWKIPLKKFEGIYHTPSNFLKIVFYKFYFVHSWNFVLFTIFILKINSPNIPWFESFYLKSLAGMFIPPWKYNLHI